MSLHLEQTDAVGELLGDRLFLVLSGGGALQSANGVAVVGANVGDIGVETVAERSVSIADACTLRQVRVRDRTHETASSRKRRDDAQKTSETEHDFEERKRRLRLWMYGKSEPVTCNVGMMTSSIDREDGGGRCYLFDRGKQVEDEGDKEGRREAGR